MNNTPGAVKDSDIKVLEVNPLLFFEKGLGLNVKVKIRGGSLIFPFQKKFLFEKKGDEEIVARSLGGLKQGEKYSALRNAQYRWNKANQWKEGQDIIVTPEEETRLTQEQYNYISRVAGSICEGRAQTAARKFNELLHLKSMP